MQLSFLFDSRPDNAPPRGTRVANGPADTSLRHIILRQGPVSYRLRRAKRKSIGFQIDDRGLTVSSPRWVSLRDVESAIQEKEVWILSRLEQWAQWRAKRRLPDLHFGDGGKLPYLGREITLRLRGDIAGSTLSEDGGELLLALAADADESRVRDCLQIWLKTMARQVLGERLALISERNQLAFKNWSLSSARSQWGSCAADGRIRLNWRLIHFTLHHIDYVVAHELAHLKEMNHSPAFWQQVGRLLPDFEPARDFMRREDIASLPL